MTTIPLTGSDATAARIRFREPVSRTGHIDAAWWPHTRDLAAELPPLLAAVWSAGRDISRVTYTIRAWDAAPRHLRIEGHTVRLGGFTTSDPLTIRLSDAWGKDRIDVLVVGPETDPATAEREMEMATRSDDDYTVAQILEHSSGGDVAGSGTRS